MMVRYSQIYIVLYVTIVQLWICWCQTSLKYRLNEETDPGFVIGNINSFLISNSDYEKYDVSLMDKYFSLLPNKDLIVKRKIDLEKSCNEANLCCGDGACVVQLSLRLTSKSELPILLKIDIDVLDINDNKPMFKTSSQTISISEYSKIGSQISVEGGFDYDVTQANQIQFYKFHESTNTFELISNDLSNLYLLQQKPVDYERQNVYHARLEACDNATRCVIQALVINIQDENDNFPMFEKRHYEAHIPESVDKGKVVIAARAIDLDGARFNKTKYGFHSNRDTYLQTKFRIDSDNGNIILLSKLSVLQRQIYQFKIFATDAGSSITGKTDIVDVKIQVFDINDHKPVIEVFKDIGITDDKGSFEVKIKENAQPKKLMSIKVTDADLGLNAKVTCELKDHTSSLEQKFFDPDIYDIHSVRLFDYEQETQIKAIFECRDSGSPLLSSYKSIRINIEDINEYAPEFNQTEFHGSIKENTGPGEIVLTVGAMDKDGAAVLTYTIEDNVIPYFAINPTTGVITTASLPFDREQISSKRFSVRVTDAVNDSRSTDAIVQISILDENDNSPVFTPSSLQFFISENQPIKSKLQGRLIANDADKDPANSYISFALIETFDSETRKCEQPYFRIKFNGDIEAMSYLDREINPNYTLTIEARDKGNPPRYTRANATVIVHDINDNSPQWIYPRPPEKRTNTVNSLPMLNITESTELFFLIMKLKAHDPDQNEAGRVSYILVNHHESLFSLNKTNGELRTERSPLPFGQYHLQLRATDHGNPPRNSDSWILINVIDSGKLTNMNLTIIIGMVGITALISVFLIIAIICVRRRPRFQQSYSAPSTDNNKEPTNQYFSHNQWMYQPTDDTIMPPLSDNESCVYLPTNYYEPQDPLILHTLSGSRPGSRLEFPIMLPTTHNSSNSDNKFVTESLQNAERTNGGTVRSINGQYCTMNASTSGAIINGQELDGDSADSGKGASEVDLRLQNHLNNANRNYPTLPFSHHSTAKSTFGGYITNPPGPQYYSVNTNPKSFDSRFLTVHPGNIAGTRRAMSPTFNSSNQCQCFILPEDDVMPLGHQDGNQLAMCNLSSMNHDHQLNYIYNDDIMAPPPPPQAPGYYQQCPYIPGQNINNNNRSVQSPVPYKDQDSQDNDHRHLDTVYNKKTSYSGAEQVNQENNIYSVALAN